ncbi:clathrin-adaptor gamma chain [Pelomyxa schiedti]|nr:clathrin-adaptor gamma chain [Pelomyxa schiedti]
MDTIENIVIRAQSAAGISLKLRDLIKMVRACKTAAEERETIAKECAVIRNSFTDEGSNKHRNVAKLLYIHMLGYPTQFGQMECLKLIASPFYADKRLGYLALMLMLDENSEVLTLATNCIQNDLNHPNQFTVGLALCSLSNIASVGIAQDCAPDVDKLLASTNPYLRKKAALAALRSIRKCPQVVETFLPKMRNLLSEKNHGVLVSSITLITEVCEMNPEHIPGFRKLVPNLLRILKSLITSGYAPEHDVSGVTDPFLQVKVLKLLRILGKDDDKASEAMGDLLAQVATNTESVRNVGNAILYECVQTIMAIKSEKGLRVLAVNILGRFLANKDNNIRYVALNTLYKVVDATDNQGVQRHRNTILDCLKDPDVSIRKRALDLVYTLVNESNVRILVRELLNYLVIADIQFKQEIAEKLCWVTARFAPSKRWHFDTFLRVITVAGNYVPEEVPSSIVTLVVQTPELYPYAVHKLYAALLKDMSQPYLLQVALWCIGEYGDYLISSAPASDPAEEEPIAEVSAPQVVELMEQIFAIPFLSELNQQFALTAAIKLTSRLPSTYSPKLLALVSKYLTNMYLEVQQRACEYINISKWENIKNLVLQHVPPKEEEGVAKPAPVSTPSPQVTHKQQILSVLDDLQNATTTTTSPTPSTPSSTSSILIDLFGPSPTPQTSAVAQIQTATSQLSLLDSPAQQRPAPPVSNPADATSFDVLSNPRGLNVVFSVSHPPGQPQLYTIMASYRNPTSIPFSDFTIKAAVPKWLKLQLNAASDTSIPAGGNITQLLRLINSQHGQSPVLMKLRFEYKTPTGEAVESCDCSFPQGI